MRLLASVLSRLAGTKLTDAASGFRAAGPRCIELFALHYPAEYLGDTIESLVIAVRTGYCRSDAGRDAGARPRRAVAVVVQGRCVPRPAIAALSLPSSSVARPRGDRRSPAARVARRRVVKADLVWVWSVPHHLGGLCSNC